MKCFLIASMLLLGIASASGEDRPHNGYWWTASSLDFKLGFVSGFATAMAQADDIRFFQCMAHAANLKGIPPDQYPGDEALETCKPRYENGPYDYDFSGIPFGQLVDGVDELYKDFQNKAIDIRGALAYVRDQVRGKKSAEELDRMLKVIRKGPSK